MPTLEVTVTQTADGMGIRIKGEARADCAGALLNCLLAPTACRPAVVTLDLSELRAISSLAMGVLTGFRRGVVRAGGRMHLAGPLRPAVHEALARADLLGLFAADAGSEPRR
jgi:anti-anti-sigma regulatory factor